jgi:hypothetical protein
MSTEGTEPSEDEILAQQLAHLDEEGDDKAGDPSLPEQENPNG